MLQLQMGSDVTMKINEARLGSPLLLLSNHNEARYIIVGQIEAAQSGQSRALQDVKPPESEKKALDPRNIHSTLMSHESKL